MASKWIFWIYNICLGGLAGLLLFVPTFDGAEIRLQGCYKDDSTSRDLPTRTIFPQATQDMCINYCADQGYTYAGMQAETSCFCGNTFGKYGAIGFGAKECSEICPGDPTRTINCGGNLASVILSVDGGFENWLNGQPNNHQGYQTCAAIEIDDSYKFNDIKCMERLGTICHIPDLNSTECEAAGHTSLNATWCLQIHNDSESWFTARRQCDAQGANMLEIRDELFNQLLSEYLVRFKWDNIGFWLGLTKGKWKWRDGEDAVYTAWHPDRPNGAEQNCVSIDDEGIWNDVFCTAVFPGVCYIDNSTLPTTTTTTTTESITPRKAEEEGITESDRNFYLIMSGVGLFVLILFIIGMCQLRLCCRDKKEKNKNDFFFQFDNKGSSTEGDSNLEQGKEVVENGHVNTGYEKQEEFQYTDIDGVTEDMTSSSTAQLTVHTADRPVSDEQKTMETFDLIADLDDKSLDEKSLDNKMMIY